MFQRQQWMKAVASQAHDSDDEALMELFESAGIPEKEAAEFLDRRGEELLLSVCN